MQLRGQAARRQVPATTDASRLPSRGMSFCQNTKQLWGRVQGPGGKLDS